MANKTIVQLPAATGINVSDIILLRQAGIDKQMSASGVCITTGQVQTISGVKTFASIPVGPASDPTTNNQLTRKKYVDDLDVLKATLPLFGAGPPASTPDFIGQTYIDTTGNRIYKATGTGSSVDWDKVAYVDYGVDTVTQDAGDLVVTLPQSWEGGTLFIFKTSTSSEYFEDGSGSAMVITTYDALTDEEATYSTDQLLTLATPPAIGAQDKGTASGGFPKSATTKSFTIDDSSTRYIKWVVIA